MAQETMKKIQVVLNINTGTTSSGGIKISTISLPEISLTGYDISKAIAVASAIAPCLEYTLVELDAKKTAMLEN